MVPLFLALFIKWLAQAGAAPALSGAWRLGAPPDLEEACGRAEAARYADWRPRIYVGDAHIWQRLRLAALSKQPDDTSTQFLPEVWLHSYFLMSELRALSPSDADLIFVPYYLRMLMEATPEMKAEAFGAVRRVLMEVNASSGSARFLLVHSSTRSARNFPKLLQDKMLLPNWHVLTFAGAWRQRSTGQVLQVDWRPQRYIFRYGHDVTIPFYIPSPLVQEGLNLARLSGEELLRKKDLLVHMFVSPNNEQRFDLLEAFQSENHRGTFKDLSVDIRVHGGYGKATDAHSVHLSMDHMLHSVFCPVPPGIIPVTRRLYEAILFECIPVLTAPTVVAFHTLAEVEDFAVLWMGGNFSELAKYLVDMPRAELLRKRRRLREVKSLFLYHEEQLRGLGGQNAGEAMLQMLKCHIERQRSS